MAITVYTYNDKVLKNVATDKWLKKPDAPAGFVMNASNVVSSSTGTAYWAGPSNPNAYDGDGKTNATFFRCGRDTTTGAAELAQIPDGWK